MIHYRKKGSSSVVHKGAMLLSEDGQQPNHDETDPQDPSQQVGET